MKVINNYFAKKISASIAITLVSGFVSSTALASIPDSGLLLEGIKNNKVVPALETHPQMIINESVVQRDTSDDSMIKVSGFHIRNSMDLQNENIQVGEIQRIINVAVGKEITLAELEELADSISHYLQQQGYLVGFAYIPAQDIKDGVIEIGIMVGRYDKIQIHNTSRLADQRITRILNSLQHGDVIKEGVLTSTLLTLSDMPGVVLTSTLVPGSVSGTSNLIVDITDGNRLTGAVYSDNHNNNFTGQERMGTSVTYKNPSGGGDDITINGVTTGNGLHNMGVVYSTPSGNHGERLEVSYSYMDYSLGGEFTDLNASGKARVVNLYNSIPLVRSRTANLTLRIGYEMKKMWDRQNGSDKAKKTMVFSVGLRGGNYDHFGGGGATNYGLTISHGKLDLLDSVDEMTASLGSAGSFNKYTLELSRQQYINKRLSAVLTFVGQTTNKNLDSSEKLFLGGPTGVRAYPEGEAAGDMGYKVSGELYWKLPSDGKKNGEWNLIGFFDVGHVLVNKNNLPGTGSNGRTLAGFGLGISWMKVNDSTVRLDYAWKLGHESAVSDTDKNGRLWARVTKYF